LIRFQAIEQAPLKQFRNSVFRRSLRYIVISSEPFEFPLMFSSALQSSEELLYASDSTLVSREPIANFSRHITRPEGLVLR
jgi:hypothetical protein